MVRRGIEGISTTSRLCEQLQSGAYAYRREPVTFNTRIPRARPERGVSAHYEILTSCSTPKHHNLRELSGIKSPDAPCFIEGHSRPLPVKLRETYASDNPAFCKIPGAG